MIKKEMKKNQVMKVVEVYSYVNQNMISSMFVGLGGRSGLFGKKKGGKLYDWMNVGRGGSGILMLIKGLLGVGKGMGVVLGLFVFVNMVLIIEGWN